MRLLNDYSMLLDEKDLKCKNHVTIGDYAQRSTLWKYMFKFPFLFWHQVVCVDNPILQKTSNTLYEKYDKYIPDALKQMYKITEKNVIKITKKITRIEQL